MFGFKSANSSSLEMVGKSAKKGYCGQSYFHSTLQSCMNKFTTTSEPILLLTPADPYFLVAWSNEAFHSFMGWSCEKILGLEIFFLHGDDADMLSLIKIFNEVKRTECSISRVVHLYTAHGSLLHCNIVVSPVFDFVANTSLYLLANLSIRFSNISIVQFPSSLLDARPIPRVFEVGMPLDRREYCLTKAAYQLKYAPSTRLTSAQDLIALCSCAESLAELLHYFMRSADSLLLLDK